MNAIRNIWCYAKKVYQKHLANAKRSINHIIKPKTPYADLVYDTLMPIDTCIHSLFDIAAAGTFKESTLFFTQISDTTLEMVVREWPLGGSCFRHTSATVEFYAVEDGRTVIRIVFHYKTHPWQEIVYATESLDMLFETTLRAYRRK